VSDLQTPADIKALAAQKEPPPGVDIWTDNPSLNEKILTGQVEVSLYEEPSESEKAAIDSKLRELGYPESYILDQPWFIKEQITTRNLEWTPETSLTPMALEPNWMSWEFNLKNISDAGFHRFQLNSWWEWLEMPTWMLTDKIGWAWASSGDDLFAAEKNSLRVYQFVHACPVTRPEPGCGVYTFESRYERYAPGAGMETEVELFGSFSIGGVVMKVDRMWGNAYLTVKAPKNGTGKRRTFTATSGYFHKQGTCNGELIFSVSPDGPSAGVGITCGWGWDSTSTPAEDYYYTD